MPLSLAEPRGDPAWRVLAFLVGFGPAIPDLVAGNAGVGLQLGLLSTGALALLVYASRPALPTRLLTDPLALLIGVFLMSVISLLTMRGIGHDASLLKWTRQLATVGVMLILAIALSRAADSAQALRRAMIAGIVSGAAFTLVTSLLFLGLHAAGVPLLLWHNNLSFVSDAVSLPAVSVRDAESILPRIYGFFTEPSFFSAYAAPSGVFLMARRLLAKCDQPREAGRASALAGAALLLLAIFVSSRTGMVAGTFGVLGVMLARRRTAVALIITGIVATFGAPIILALSPLLFPESLTVADVSVLERTAAAAIGLAEFQAHPVLGVGFGTFGFAYTEGGDLAVGGIDQLLAVVSNQQAAEKSLPNAFNLVVRLAAETGVIGLLALAGLVVSLARTSLRGSVTARAASLATMTYLVAGIDSFVMLQFWLFWALARGRTQEGSMPCAS